MSSSAPALLSLATAEAPHAVSQGEVQARALELFADAPFAAELAGVFANAGIERRTLALPLADYGPLEAGLRNRLYLDAARRMLADAGRRAVPAAWRAQVTHVVLVSSTGIATPSLDCALVESLGLAAHVRRVPVFGLGCAGGVAGLAIARDLARSDERALVLLACVELTSLTFLASDRSRQNFVACALFGDGAAAALVGRPRAGARALAALGATRARLFPDTTDLMGWDVQAEGWRVVFSPRIPAIVREHAAELVGALADRRALRHFVLHPGGARILAAYREALELAGPELGPSTRVLARCGNMSAATIFFVLADVLQDARFEAGPGVATAFGPGFSAESCALELERPLGDGALA